jgi:hypothetical protein
MCYDLCIGVLSHENADLGIDNGFESFVYADMNGSRGQSFLGNLLLVLIAGTTIDQQ